MEHAQELLLLAASLVATLFGFLVSLLSWMGNKVYQKLDEMSQSLKDIEGDLRGKISDLDRRVTRVELSCEVHRREE